MSVQKTVTLICALGCFSCFVSCSTAQSSKEKEEADAKANQLAEIQTVVTGLSTRVEALEGRVSTMNDKVDATQASIELLTPTPTMPKAKTTAVQAHPGKGAGVPVKSQPSPHDPEAGFVNDEAVQAYRKAMVFFQAHKFSESVLAFSAFLEEYPDHPLAGAAQYYVGKSYLSQKEYKLAINEFQRVLTSYDRSSHVSLTLRDMALAEDQVKQNKEASRHRQLLSSLFPQAPATNEGVTSVSASPETEKMIVTPGTPANGLPGLPGLDEPPPPTAPVNEVHSAVDPAE